MSLATQGIKFGAHYPIRAGGDMLEAINLWESPHHAGRRMDIVNHFRHASEPSGNAASARISLQQACGAGRIPMVTWEFQMLDGSQGPYSLESIAAGVHDEYLLSWADSLFSLQRPVALRPMHEMNGDWYPWSGNPVAYRAAWRHMVDVFRSRGAGNVMWVWCVNASDQPKGNALEDYWPGEKWVDILGMDGYNGYSTTWRSFDQIIRPAYQRLCALSPTLPVWVCETATAEGGPRWPGTDYTSKAQWIEDMFATEGMERIKAVCWFDENNNSSYDWRADTTGRALQALTTGLANSAGYVPPPGPYVPPTPDRIVANYLGPGICTVAWRTIPAFHRGCTVTATHEDGFTIRQTVLKPAASVRLVGLPAGRYSVTVASYTLVRHSKTSAPVVLDVAEPF